MRKKIIAALIVGSTICWSVTPAAASFALRSFRSVHERSASAHQHNCCPQARGSVVPVMMAAPAPAKVPCGGQHPCCMQQAPDRSPALPVAKEDSQQRSANLSTIATEVTYISSFVSSTQTRYDTTAESALLRSTVLR